jgi:hypothetical protein
MVKQSITKVLGTSFGSGAHSCRSLPFARIRSISAIYATTIDRQNDPIQIKISRPGSNKFIISPKYRTHMESNAAGLATRL